MCEDGFIEGYFACYSVVSDSQNHTDYQGALAACQAISGHLAYPGDYEEQTVISDALNELDVSGVLFMGMFCIWTQLPQRFL